MEKVKGKLNSAVVVNIWKFVIRSIYYSLKWLYMTVNGQKHGCWMFWCRIIQITAKIASLPLSLLLNDTMPAFTQQLTECVDIELTFYF